ncbi:MAG: glycosyltransferase family 4 protein [Limisphaerales bacterium]
MTPLRILQVNSLFRGGGVDNQTLELAAGLREGGDAVTLSVPDGSRWEPRARRLGLPTETFPAKSPLQLAMIRRWARLLRDQGIQIIHAHQGRDYWPAILAARWAARGTRVVVTRHLMTRPRTLSRCFLLRLGDVVAVSHAVEDVLRRELRGPGHRLHQIYGGIDVQLFHPERTPAAETFRADHGWTADMIVLGVAGACDLPRGKGQLEFLEAAAQVRTDFPRARFALIGSGTMEPLVRERLRRLELEMSATLIPFTDDLPVVMNALDVLVHPALGTEALGLVLWEAMASAKPVIASRLDGIPEAFIEGEHGLLVPPADAPALADAMRALLNDPGRRVRFGLAGRDYVCSHFTRARLAEHTRKLYRDLLSRSGSN